MLVQVILLIRKSWPQKVGVGGGGVQGFLTLAIRTVWELEAEPLWGGSWECGYLADAVLQVGPSCPLLSVSVCVVPAEMMQSSSITLARRGDG